MKPKVDASNEELKRVLDVLLAADIDITAREVARRHAGIKSTSAFTRDPDRMELIERACDRQMQLRSTLNPHFKQSKSLADKLNQVNEVNTQLNTQVRALVASHAACIQAVMKVGGMGGLERFWKEYKSIGEAVRPAMISSERAEVVPLKVGKRSHKSKDA